MISIESQFATQISEIAMHCWYIKHPLRINLHVTAIIANQKKMIPA